MKMIKEKTKQVDKARYGIENVLRRESARNKTATPKPNTLMGYGEIKEKPPCRPVLGRHGGGRLFGLGYGKITRYVARLFGGVRNNFIFCWKKRGALYEKSKAALLYRSNGQFVFWHMAFFCSVFI